MQYKLVFDASTAPIDLWRVVPPLLFTVVGCVAAWRPSLFRGPAAGPAAGPAKVPRAIGVAVALVSFWMAISTWQLLSVEQERFRSALRAGRYTLVEGKIANFQPGRPSCHPKEEFDVGRHHFSYGPCLLSTSFQKIAAQGGPLREGLQVRIADVDGSIVRVELAR